MSSQRALMRGPSFAVQDAARIYGHARSASICYRPATLSAVHRAAAVSPVTASVNWADNKTIPCYYGAVHPADYHFHWSCLTKGGAKGYLNGPFSYKFSGGTATITISFTASMKSWPGN